MQGGPAGLGKRPLHRPAVPGSTQRLVGGIAASRRGRRAGQSECLRSAAPAPPPEPPASRALVIQHDGRPCTAAAALLPAPALRAPAAALTPTWPLDPAAQRPDGGIRACRHACTGGECRRPPFRCLVAAAPQGGVAGLLDVLHLTTALHVLAHALQPERCHVDASLVAR